MPQANDYTGYNYDKTQKAGALRRRGGGKGRKENRGEMGRNGMVRGDKEEKGDGNDWNRAVKC